MLAKSLQKIDQEATRQKRSRSEYIEPHFETLFFKSQKQNGIFYKIDVTIDFTSKEEQL